MKKSTKAALLSALVFPGAGHLYLKKYASGTALLAISCACIYYVISYSLHQAMQIVGQIQNGTTPADVSTITNLVTQQSSGPQAQLMSATSTVIVICWVIGIIDSYRLGHAKDKTESEPGADEKESAK